MSHDFFSVPPDKLLDSASAQFFQTHQSPYRRMLWVQCRYMAHKRRQARSSMTSWVVRSVSRTLPHALITVDFKQFMCPSCVTGKSFAMLFNIHLCVHRLTSPVAISEIQPTNSSMSSAVSLRFTCYGRALSNCSYWALYSQWEGSVADVLWKRPSSPSSSSSVFRDSIERACSKLQPHLFLSLPISLSTLGQYNIIVSEDDQNLFSLVYFSETVTILLF
jgi:hypothetical protein